MPLMDRIKTTDFLSLSEEAQHQQICALQLLRTNKIKEERLKPKTKRRKTTKAKGKRKAKSGKTAEQKALQALKKLSPEQLKLMEKLI